MSNVTVQVSPCGLLAPMTFVMGPRLSERRRELASLGAIDADTDHAPARLSAMTCVIASRRRRVLRADDRE